jgi:diaminopimelate epimerase
MEPMIAGLTMSKHEGAGNDFLIMVDLEDRVGLTPAEVAQLCDRHRGVGADGLITVTLGTGGGEVTMQLANADGSAAEISGNGLRCMSHEVVRSGLVAPGAFSVMTAAGLRRVTCAEPTSLRTMTTAEMGEVELVEIDRAAGRARLEVGNPHLVVLVEDLDQVDVAHEGLALQSTRPGGINVEWIQPDGKGGLALRVYERGVGPTLACGSGSCAAAVAGRALGIVGDVVEVANPGGVLTVELEDNAATLSGEVRVVADLFVPLERMR